MKHMGFNNFISNIKCRSLYTTICGAFLMPLKRQQHILIATWRRISYKETHVCFSEYPFLNSILRICFLRRSQYTENTIIGRPSNLWCHISNRWLLLGVSNESGTEQVTANAPRFSFAETLDAIWFKSYLQVKYTQLNNAKMSKLHWTIAKRYVLINEVVLR